ncbi:DUF4192 domain-containing protein [Nocardia callitridis]|uniref:DUF4192 domain-containing protein n=1 Tax=Nocardia callitridis TaxID=648753 RepID=A0ABP9KEC1_9NOCA
MVLVLRRAQQNEAARVDAVVRFDLDGEGGQRIRAGTLASHVIRICAQADAAEVLMVVVDDRADGSDLAGRATRDGAAGTRGADRRFAALVAAVARRVGAHDVELGGAWAVGAIAPQQRWWSLSDANQGGTLPDPATSVVTLSHVLDGRLIRASRADLAAMVACDDELAATMPPRLDRAFAASKQRYTEAARQGNPDNHSRQALEHLLWQIANVESGVELMPVEIAEIAVALRDRSIRDAAFGLAIGDHAVAAEQLWVVLTRALPGADRAEAATLLAYSAYVRGDGSLAGIALEAALTAMATHSIAVLLDTSLRLGMRPDQIRRLALSGRRIADALGVDLGPVAG